jgi:hypothetical protein
MKKTLAIIAMLLGITVPSCGPRLVVRSDKLKEPQPGPRWGVVEARTDIQYGTQMKAARKQMEKYCASQCYKVVETRVASKTVPTWAWTGTHMISTGDQIQRWEYIKFICVECGK